MSTITHYKLINGSFKLDAFELRNTLDMRNVEAPSMDNTLTTIVRDLQLTCYRFEVNFSRNVAGSVGWYTVVLF